MGDARGSRTFVGICRLIVASLQLTGEILIPNEDIARANQNVT